MALAAHAAYIKPCAFGLVHVNEAKPVVHHVPHGHLDCVRIWPDFWSMVRSDLGSATVTGRALSSGDTVSGGVWYLVGYY